ncbi:hypothetical protein [Streptomyces brevispora]|uniref:Uncharacterized protein n=1 Tax=Streptomyces brevispora TaxID=887462 RepID=A0ABZ1GCN4_9ACTN|nr:hypothetical protein [Streptomyces brevispora]WSC16981.1 hypothetical protein OIE64_31885 [Streptomyces brevispora]
MDKLAAVVSRYLKRWCYSSGGAQVAHIAAGFLIECMQEVHQFLADVRGDASAGRRAAGEAGQRPGTACLPWDRDHSLR